MLPSFLFSSYKQYKTDSDAVVTWLANTAHQCGYPKNLLPGQAVSQQKAPRLKGKARKLAREAAQNKSPADSQTDDLELRAASEGPKYFVAIKDFIVLAEWIAKSTRPRIGVPASFVSLLDRAIAARRRHNDWWYNQNENHEDNTERGKRANEGHGYFIGVLEKVQNILQPRMTKNLRTNTRAQSAERRQTSKDSTTSHMVNLFENLDIEEPSDDVSNSYSTPSSQKPLNTPQVKYLRIVWEGYEKRVYDLVAASVTTNTAIEFTRRLHEDFIEIFPEHTDFDQYMVVMFSLRCRAVDQDPCSKERPDDEMNFAAYENSDSILFPAYWLLGTFNKALKEGRRHSYSPGFYAVYDVSSDRASKSPPNKFREDKTVLFGILADLYLIAPQSAGMPDNDEIMRGMHEIEQQKVPIWLALGAQIFLDIHHVLRAEVNRGFEDLVNTANYVETNVKDATECLGKTHIESWTKLHDQSLEYILDVITEGVKTDAVGDMRTKSFGILASPAEPFTFLKNHPLYCGLLSYSIRALAQEAGIAFANACGSVLHCAHLYSALRREELMTSVWSDMDLVLHMHPPEHIFIGEPPTAIDGYLKRLCLAAGFSANLLAKNKRQTRPSASKAGARILRTKDISPISEMFKSRYCEYEGRTKLSLDNVDTIFEKHIDDDEETGSKESSIWAAPRINIIIKEGPPRDPNIKGAEPTKPHDGLRKTQRITGAAVHPIQLLNAIHNAIQSETLALTFDYFRLHFICWELLHAIKESLDTYLSNILGPSNYGVRENRLPDVVFFIFTAAIQESEIANMLVSKKKDAVTRKSLHSLHIAAEVMQKKLRRLGTQQVLMLGEVFNMKMVMPYLTGLIEFILAGDDSTAGEA